MEKHPIPDALGYFITIDGIVYSEKKSEPLTAKRKSPESYPILEYYVNGKRYRKYIHRILAELFIPKLAGKDFINHIDGNKGNHTLSNLEWCSHRENLEHASMTGLLSNREISGARNGRVKLTEANVLYIRNSNKTLNRLSEIFGVSKHTIFCAKSGKTWKHLANANQP